MVGAGAAGRGAPVGAAGRGAGVADGDDAGEGEGLAGGWSKPGGNSDSCPTTGNAIATASKLPVIHRADFPIVTPVARSRFFMTPRVRAAELERSLSG